MQSRSALWTGASALLSSGTNAGVALYAGIRLDHSDYGYFAGAVTLLLLAATVINSFAGEIDIVRRTDLGSRPTGGAALLSGPTVAATLAAVAAGPVAVVGCTLWALGNDQPLGALVVLSGIAMPLVATMEALRYDFFARGRADRAALADAMWGGAAVAALVMARLAGVDHSPLVVTGAWALSSLVPVAALAAGTVSLPDRRSVALAFAERGKLGAGFSTDVILKAGSLHVPTFILGWYVSAEALGSLRFAQLLMGPAAILSAATRLTLAPALRDSAAMGQRRTRGVAALAAGAMSVAALALAAILALSWSWIAPYLNPSLAESARKILWPIAFATAFGMAGDGATLALRVLQRPQTLVVGRTGAALLVAVGGTGGAFYGALEGTAIGLALGHAGGAVWWWACVLHADTSAVLPPHR